MDDALKLRRLPLVVEVGRKPGCPFRKERAKVLAEPPRKVRPRLKPRGPYRKPTQVDGSSRPRCARETTLRNSAK